MMKIIPFLFFLLSFSTLIAGDSLQVKKTLSATDFIAIVKQFHPVVKQSAIIVQKAGAAVSTARGGFDPLLYMTTDQKTLDGKSYFSYANPELKIPTWYGIEVKAGFENNGGYFLNSEASAGTSSYVGITVPLAKNLLMDKRRAALQQAKIFQQQSEAERQLMINDLLYEAYSSYWNWVKEKQLYAIITHALKNNEARMELVRIGFRQGDRPAIDTIEALTQLQSFQYLQSESLVRLNNSLIELSNFLWLPNSTYYQLDLTIEPASTWDLQQEELPLPDELIYQAKLLHPKIKAYQYKLQILEVEKKLKFQSLLPTINVRANLLSKGYDLIGGIGKAGYFENNNKFGLNIGLPLRLSEGRGDYKAAKLKLQETNFDLLLKQQEIENKIKQYYNEYRGLQQQVVIYEAAYKNYQALFRGEDTRFKAGESSLFLLNSRESKQLEALQKLVELKTKFAKAKQSVLWAAGQLK